MPFHFALRRAFETPTFAHQELGAFFSVLCPNSIDVEVDARRLRLSKTQGEFLLLAFLVARIHGLYGSMMRYSGFNAGMVSGDALAAFPRVAGENGQTDPYVSLLELLGLDLLEPDAVRKVRAAGARSMPAAPTAPARAADVG